MRACFVAICRRLQTDQTVPVIGNTTLLTLYATSAHRSRGKIALETNYAHVVSARRLVATYTVAAECARHVDQARLW